MKLQIVCDRCGSSFERESSALKGKKPRPLQLSRHRLLRELGYRVYVIDDPKQIGGMLNEIRTT